MRRLASLLLKNSKEKQAEIYRAATTVKSREMRLNWWIGSRLLSEIPRTFVSHPFFELA